MGGLRTAQYSARFAHPSVHGCSHRVCLSYATSQYVNQWPPDPNGTAEGVNIPLRPLMQTPSGRLFTEPRAHRRPFPKRRAVPFDRWRNSGGKRGSTAVKGKQLTMLRRYGNVIIHESESVRYVEYSVLSDQPAVPSPAAGASPAGSGGQSTPPPVVDGQDGAAAAGDGKMEAGGGGKKRQLDAMLG